MFVPAGGTHYWVDGVLGGDGNSCLSPKAALKTLSAAYAKTVTGKNDCIHIIGDGASTGTTRLAATLTWAKDAVHLVGHCSGSPISQRARIAPTSTAVQFTPLMTVSGNGCLFQNVAWFSGFTAGVDAANGCLNVTGSRNVFSNCHIAGGGTTAAANHASMYSLQISGGQENFFNHCTIGLDTVVRSAANAEIVFASAAARNIFEDCTVLSMCDDATHLFVSAASAGAIDRFVIFKNTLFHNAVASTSTTMTVGMDLHVSMGGTIILSGNTFMVGATDVADQFTGVWGLTASGNGTYAQGVGLAVQVA
jgi:hypothetical protein